MIIRPIPDIVRPSLLEHLATCNNGYCQDFNALIAAYETLANEVIQIMAEARRD